LLAHPDILKHSLSLFDTRWRRCGGGLAHELSWLS